MARVASAVAITGVATLVLAALAAAAGIRVNTSASIPQGLYRVVAEPLARGAYVLVCPPQRAVFDQARDRGYLGAGPCPGGYGYLMKRVLGVSGDDIAVADDGVRINGQLLVRSAPRGADGAGRPLPQIRTRLILAETELLLMSDARASAFDGRYFGPLPQESVVAVIQPLLTWPR